MRTFILTALTALAFSASAAAGPSFAGLVKDAAKKKETSDTTKTDTAEKKKYSDVI